MEEEVEVRTLDGESITIAISPDRSVRDLKAILNDSFLPAIRSPNFHLFFKGAKLTLETQVGNFQMKNGEFLVIVPFTRKSHQFPLESAPPEEVNNSAKCSEASSAADSTWKDIMNDLSSLSSTPRAETTPINFGSLDNLDNGIKKAALGGNSSNLSLNRKRKKAGDLDDVLLELLHPDIMNLFERHTSDRVCQIVESVNCLSNPDSDRCFLFEKLFRLSNETDRCMCPPWLKRFLKVFTFLNVLYAFFQMQRTCISWDCLERVFKQPGSFALDDFGVSDVENLSVLFPKVVAISDRQETPTTRLSCAIVIGNSEPNDMTSKCRSARKQVPRAAVINSIFKRWSTFRTELWRSLKNCMERKLSKTSMLVVPSFEDLIMEKDNVAASESSEAKSVKNRSLASPCHGVHTMEPAEMVEHLKQGIGKNGQIVHLEEMEAKNAVYVEFPNNLSEALREALKHIGISRLYSHQVKAIQSSISGKNVIVATSTSSGKSVCYNVPVLEALSQNLLSCALYIFPTKALAQDQLRTLLEMKIRLKIDLNISIYDGDTSKEDRIGIRDNARLLITNPDMLHMSILPHHRQFKRILSNLRYIVTDEAHAYKGAFGCHTALVFRRLRRICSNVYGSDPSFIFCTATSANPREHAMELANLKNLELIQNDGSPCGPKYFLLWNPPLILKNRSKTLSSKENVETDKSALRTQRSSPIMEIAYLFAEMVQHGLRCIAFCKTRKLCELVLCYTHEILQATAQNLVHTVCVYRAGYISQERRRIEADLFDGKLRGVAATSALELGIDVGHVDVTLHLGFPGSVASLWQQAGRSGRRARPSLAIYVAFEGPLDQYFMKFPQKLFGRAIEHCQVDSNNQKVLEQHVACAAYELPLCLQYDEKYFGPCLNLALMVLKNKGHLCNNPTGSCSTKTWNYIGPEGKPSYSVSLRAIENEKYRVVDRFSNETLEEIEESKAFFQVYEGAVYIHQGVTYLVDDLDLSSKIAFCQKADLKYYTKTRDYTDIHVVGGDLAYPSAKESECDHIRTTAEVNSCKVTTKWFGFYRIWRASNKIFDRVELALPTYSYDSQAAWTRVPQSVKTAVEMQGLQFRAGLHAASHALLNVVPLYMMCNASDMGTECANPHETRAIPERILLYDRHPGGIGIASQVQRLFGELLAAALEQITTCNCLGATGCPNCVQTLSCGEYNEVLDKGAALLILKGVIESERSYFEGRGDSLKALA
ncbi:uncharacterized protein [Typha angustifolia]|uniref:uncharacterized protein isoform X1 n=1 Tax=Typha angustifolia TaxID=59011 RepID=UPI003C2ED8C9